MADSDPLIIVSNRGPAQFERNEEGERTVQRGGGGLVTALSGLVSHRDALWIASAMTNEDVAVSDVIDLDNSWAALHAYWFSLATSHDPDQISTVDVDAYNDTDENWPLREGYGALVARWGAEIPVTLNAAAERIRWGSGGVVVETEKATYRAAQADPA